MKEQIMNLLLDMLTKNISFDKTADKILSLLGENTESVSNDSVESSDLHVVRTTECEAISTTESAESFVGGTLENRIDSENNFYCENGGWGGCLTQCKSCYNEENDI